MNDKIIHLFEMFKEYRSLRVSEKFLEVYKSCIHNDSLLHCLSKFIDWRIVEQHSDLNWNRTHFYSNPNIKWEFIKDHIENYATWQISMNPCVNLEIVRKHPEIEWDWECISANPSVTLDDIMNNPEEKWCYYNMTENPNLTLQFVSDNIEKNWNWEMLSRKLKMEDISTFSAEIDWEKLCYNKNITFEFVCKNLHRNWNWYGLYGNSKVVYAILKDGKFVPNIDSIKHLIPEYTEKLFWWGFSSNESVTIEVIKDNLDKDWNWNDLSQNRGVKWQDIKNNPDLKWDDCSIFFNPNSDEKVLLECVDRISKFEHFFEIATNVSEDFELEIKREWLAARKIKNWYFK